MQLPDGSRVDVRTKTLAIELDWLSKTDEGIGRCIRYGRLTGKRPVVAVAIRKWEDDPERVALTRELATKHGVELWVVRSE